MNVHTKQIYLPYNTVYIRNKRLCTGDTVIILSKHVVKTYFSFGERIRGGGVASVHSISSHLK